MKISIITATYNSYPNILGTIESIRQQTYPSIEWIVVDGGSKDKTQLIINSTPFISQVVSEPDKGIYDALNKGIVMATGEIIGFLHSDDLLATENILERIAQTFKETKADVLYGDLTYVDKNNINKVIRFWKSQPLKPESLKRGWMPAHPTVFVRREVYEKHGIFDLSFKIAADYDLMLRIFQDHEFKFVYLPEVITRMRVGGTSNRSIKNIIQKSSEDYSVMIKNKLPFPAWTLICKNLSKIPQFLKKQKLHKTSIFSNNQM